MNELSLFTGAGGGLLGSILLGWQTIGAVEIEEYPCKVIEQRQKDGILSKFPIWQMDIREFNNHIAALYKGKVDVITAGWPCPPWSIAGAQKGESDERNLWPELHKTISIIRPENLLLENVPGILQSSYWGTILSNLAESGYSGRYATLPAYIAGAPQIGKRVWFVLSTNRKGLEGIHDKGNGIYLQSIKIDISQNIRKATPRVYRPGNGISYRVERTKAYGQAQVPGMVKTAWNILNKDWENEKL